MYSELFYYFPDFILILASNKIVSIMINKININFKLLINQKINHFLFIFY
jgi:hypothetical protein